MFRYLRVVARQSASFDRSVWQAGETCLRIKLVQVSLAIGQPASHQAWTAHSVRCYHLLTNLPCTIPLPLRRQKTLLLIQLTAHRLLTPHILLLQKHQITRLPLPLKSEPLNDLVAARRTKFALRRFLTAIDFGAMLLLLLLAHTVILRVVRRIVSTISLRCCA